MQKRSIIDALRKPGAGPRPVPRDLATRFVPRLALVIVIVIGALGVVACAASPTLDADHAALVAAERAFAKHADDADIRTAFRAAFAPDGIWMVPGPMGLEDAYAARPAPADPRALRLIWDPVISGIAASGDFGFTSGPSEISRRDNSALPGYGAYFSIWKRDGQRWRVALDAGIPSKTPIAPDALAPSPRVRPPLATVGGARSPLDLERGTTLSSDAFVALLADDVRHYREGPPTRGASSIRVAIASSFPMTLAPAGGEVAPSNDLAYTYGAWRAAAANGHYVHLWTRDERGAWKIALVIHT